MRGTEFVGMQEPGRLRELAQRAQRYGGGSDRRARACRPRALSAVAGPCVATPVGQLPVWQVCAYKQPSANMKPRAELHQSAPSVITRAMSNALTSLPAQPSCWRRPAHVPVIAATCTSDRDGAVGSLAAMMYQPMWSPGRRLFRRLREDPAADELRYFSLGSRRTWKVSSDVSFHIAAARRSNARRRAVPLRGSFGGNLIPTANRNPRVIIVLRRSFGSRRLHHFIVLRGHADE
jgi:hypothetical protein